MKKCYLFSILMSILFSISSVNSIYAQKTKTFEQSFSKGEPVICYSRSENMHTKVLPSADILKEMAAARLANGEAQSQIIVTYYDFTPEAQAAFQYAVDIWASLLVSEVPIRIDAYWRPLDLGVLGSASASTFYMNFPGAEKANTYYPVAMAEKMAGKNLNKDTDSDLYANFNSRNANWYLGTDGNTPVDKTDFVSVVLHEIGHGIGFISTMYKDGAIGVYGLGAGFPTIYDQYIIDSQDQYLVDVSIYENPSDVLGSELTSGKLFFNSPKAVLEYTKAPKLFAPNPYDGGSSISHLDEEVFKAGDPNSLMSPQLGRSEAIHDPGLGLTMLKDMGWAHTVIVHESLRDREDINSSLIFNAVVYSDYDFDPSTLKLYYSYDGFASEQNVTLTNQAGTNNYTATVDATGNEEEFSYYISVDETTNNKTIVVPAEAPLYTYSFNIGADTIKPVIAHTPIDFLLSIDEKDTLEVVASDNIGLNDVYVELYVNDVHQGDLSMSNAEQDEKYSLELVLGQNLAASNGDVVKYRIVAVDSSSNANEAYFPETGFQEFLVDDIGEPVESYASDFNTTSNDFIGGNGFSIRDEAGFDDGAIHTAHPYSNGGNEDFEANYVYQLKYPIIIAQEGAFMTFREVVLVEPGADGVKFGGNDFWDYVIVEGSVNNGETWVPVVDGYDSRDKSNWLSVYNSDIVPDPDNASGENSIAVGDESLYHLRVINLSKVFEAGDEVQIRFRLFADQLANGWGWAIDDLNVQGDIVLNTEDEILSSISIYPNPTSGQVQLDLNLNHFDQNVHVEVLDKLGRVKLQKVSKNTRNTNIQLDMTGMPVGLYFIKLKTGEKESVHKVILTN